MAGNRSLADLRVALEVSPLSQPGHDRGLGTYVRAVREAIDGRVHSVLPVSVRRRAGRAAELAGLIDRRRALARLTFDVFHATTPYVTAGPLPGRSVSSILDLIPLEVSSHRRTGLKAALFYRLAAGADAVLTLSEFSAARIAARLGVPRSRIFVAPLPPRPAFHPAPADADRVPVARLGVRSPYFLALADVRHPDPRKRVEWLSPIGKALHEVGVGLVVVGGGTERPGPELRHCQGIGRVSDEELAALYRRSLALVYPSAYEGQGLPPLEALASGTPVVAMANTAIPEVVGDAGLLLPEEASPAEAAGGPHALGDRGCARMIEACLALWRDDQLRSDIAARAPAQVARYTPGRFADALARAYAWG